MKIKGLNVAKNTIFEQILMFEFFMGFGFDSGFQKYFGSEHLYLGPLCGGWWMKTRS
jgi:hypothetical protein